VANVRPAHIAPVHLQRILPPRAAVADCERARGKAALINADRGAVERGGSAAKKYRHRRFGDDFDRTAFDSRGLLLVIDLRMSQKGWADDKVKIAYRDPAELFG
jgi:hypothetical protein